MSVNCSHACSSGRQVSDGHDQFEVPIKAMLETLTLFNLPPPALLHTDNVDGTVGFFFVCSLLYEKHSAIWTRSPETQADSQVCRSAQSQMERRLS